MSCFSFFFFMKAHRGPFNQEPGLTQDVIIRNLREALAAAQAAAQAAACPEPTNQGLQTLGK
jgi:hypothetical protein